MDFEHVLNIVGSYGKYQRNLVYVYLGPAVATGVILTMACAFLVQTPTHWCNVPELGHLSPEEQRYLISPKVDKHGLETLSNCHMYDVNYTQVLNHMNVSAFEYRKLYLEGKVQTRKCDHGWTYDKTFLKNSAATKYNLVCEKESEASYILTLAGVGRVIGTPIICYISDNYGRRTAFFTCLTLAIFAWLTPIFDFGHLVFAVFRFINGMALPAVLEIPHILVTEVVGAKQRSLVSLITYIAWGLGMVILPGLAAIAQDWQILALLSVSIGVANYSFLFFLPESPMWLISQKRYKEAHSVLESIAKQNNRKIPKDFVDMLQKINTNSDGQASHTIATSQLFLNKFILFSLILLSATWILCDFSYYVTLFNFDNLSGNPYLNFALMGSVEVISIFIAWSLMDTRLGRRLTVAFLLFISGSSYFISLTFPPHLSMYTTICTMSGRSVSLAAFIAMYQIMTECLPTPIRSQGIAVVSVASSSLHFIVPHVAVLGRTSVKIPLLITAICMYVGVFIASLLPETLNINLPQTVKDCENLWRKRKFLSLAQATKIRNNMDANENELKALS